MHSAFESGGEAFEAGGLAEEGEPLGYVGGGFIVLEHGSSVVDEVVDVLLHGSSDESDEQAYVMGGSYLVGSSRKA